MLQSIRDRTQGWIAGIIIGLVILSFALWGIHSYLQGVGNTDVIAKVDGTEISKRQLSATYERLRRQLQTNMGADNLSSNIDVDLKRRALEALINIQVLKQASIKDNYRVSSRQVDYYLESMPEFQVNGQFSLPRFQQLIATTSYSMGEFLDLINTTLLVDQPRLGIILSSFAMPDEVNTSISLINQLRDIDYLILPRDYFMHQNISVSEDEIQAYYKAHQEEFKTPEQLVIDYIALSHKDLARDFTPTDDVLKNFYNENINTYTQAQQWNIQKIFIPVPENADEKALAAVEKKATDIQDKVSKGADFEAFAVQYPVAGDNPKTANWVQLSQVPAELQKAVSQLTIAGQVSDPVKTDKGIWILKAVGVKEAKVEPFDQVKDKVKETLALQHAEEKFSEIKEKLANISYEHPDSLASAAKELNLPISTSAAFTREKGGDDLSNSKKVRDTAFSDDVMVSQNNSDVIQVSPDLSIVMHVKAHTQATELPLNDVHQKISDALTTQKAEEKAAAAAAEIKQKLQSGTSPDQIAQQYNISWIKAGSLGRYSTKVDSAILDTAFRMSRPQDDKSVSYAITKTPNGYAIVAMKGVEDGTSGPNKDQFEAFSEQTQNSMGALEYKLYEQSLTKKAKIVSYLDSPDKDNS